MSEIEDQKLADPKESLVEKNKITAAGNLTEAFEQGAEKTFVAWGLAGVGNKKAMELRNKLLDAGADVNDIAGGLIGVEHEESMELRNRLLDEGADVNYIAQGLVATANQLSMEFREKLVGEGVAANSLSGSLLGVDNPRSMDWREWLLKEGHKLPVIGSGGDETYKKEIIAESILWNLAEIDSEESMKLREKLFLSSNGFNSENIKAETEVLPLLSSFRWVGNDKSMDVREKALPCFGSGRDICLSLWGVGNPRSMSLREYLLEQANNKKIHPTNYHSTDFNPHKVIAESLLGVENPESMRLRKKIFQNIQHNNEGFHAIIGLMISLMGIASPESMRLREEFFCIGEKLDKKKPALNYLAVSLTGVVNQESKKLREKYFGGQPNLIAKSYGSGPSDSYPAFIPLHGYRD